MTQRIRQCQECGHQEYQERLINWCEYCPACRKIQRANDATEKISNEAFQEIKILTKQRRNTL